MNAADKLNLRVTHLGFESTRSIRDPRRKLRDLRMGPQLLHGVPFPLEILFGKDRVDLRVARPTNPNRLFHLTTVKFLLVPFIAVPGAGNEVMPGQDFFATADDTRWHIESEARQPRGANARVSKTARR
jgi:hypothetical protein